MTSVKIKNLLLIRWTKCVFILISIFAYPLYFLNKRDHKKNIKKNPFYTSRFVRLANRFPWLYDIMNFVWNYPKHKRIYDVLPPISGQVLQVGCGTGLLNQYYRNRQDLHLINLDLNIHALKYGLKKGRFTEYIHSSINKVPLKDQSVDTIIFARSYHHIRHHKKAFKECTRLLKREGTIIILDPVSLQKEELSSYKKEGYMANSSVDGVIWRFTKEAFKNHLEGSLPSELHLESLSFIRQIHITNYNFKYPQTDALAIIKRL